MSRKALPPTGAVESGEANPEAIDRFLDATIDHESSYHITLFSEWEKARLFYLGGENQWIEPDYTDDPTRTPFWRPIEVDETNWYPMPSQNEIVAPVQNEVSRLLGGSGTRPYVRVDDDSPEAVKGARVATDVLLDSLEKRSWPILEHRWVDWATRFGDAILKSYIDIDYTQTVKVGVEGAMRCTTPGCDFRLASAKVPAGKASAALEGAAPGSLRVASAESINPMMPPVMRATVVGCMTCPADAMTGRPAPLEPYTPEGDEVQAQDHFGRPLGEDQPLVDAGLRVIPPQDYWMENGGLRVDAETAREHYEERVESLEWICNHYPNGPLVKAQSPAEMARWHPVIGTSMHYGDGKTDARLYQHHAMVREAHVLPQVTWKNKRPVKDRGRSVVVAGDPMVILQDDDYLIESKRVPGKLIPRAVYGFFAWEQRSAHEGRGLGLVKIITPQQETINSILAQDAYVRDNFGNPKLMAEVGANLFYANFREHGYRGDVYYYQPTQGGQPPTPISGQGMAPQAFQQLQLQVENVGRISGTTESETGNPPGGGVTAASAIMYMGEKSSERRKPRILRMRAAKKRVFTHHLQVLEEYAAEPRKYAKNVNGRDILKSFTGDDFSGQTDVHIEDEPAFDLRMFRRESIKDGLQAGTIKADTQNAVVEINRELGIPNTINKEQNRQVEMAEDEWTDYLERGYQPVVSVRGDSHPIHFKTHQISLHSPEVLELKQALDYGQVELALWGWEEQFDALVQAEQLVKANPVSLGLRPPPTPPPGVTPTPEEQQAERQAAEQDLALRQQAAATVAAAPKALELRILYVWTKILEASPTQFDAERMKDVAQLLRFEAHTEAHRRVDQQQQLQAAGGTPMPAPEGGPETPRGNIPSMHSTVIAGPGSGPGALTQTGGGGQAAA